MVGKRDGLTLLGKKDNFTWTLFNRLVGMYDDDDDDDNDDNDDNRSSSSSSPEIEFC